MPFEKSPESAKPGFVGVMTEYVIGGMKRNES